MPTVQTFRIVVRALARQGALVPSRPPIRKAEWAYHDSAFVHGAVARDLLILVFKPRASQAQRQEAVDLIGATVVGGMRLHTGDGFYELFVPNAESETKLRTLAARLDSLPQVQGAMPMTPAVSGSPIPRPSQPKRP